MRCEVDKSTRYWFRAKRYGLGWGAPLSWQGWVVFFVWMALTIPGSVWLTLRGLWGTFSVFMLVMCAILIAICYIKGEPLRWRWDGE
jgi:hypothetical protein